MAFCFLKFYKNFEKKLCMQNGHPIGMTITKSDDSEFWTSLMADLDDSAPEVAHIINNRIESIQILFESGKIVVHLWLSCCNDRLFSEYDAVLTKYSSVIEQAIERLVNKDGISYAVKTYTFWG
jgi:hypothetical protein